MISELASANLEAQKGGSVSILEGVKPLSLPSSKGRTALTVSPDVEFKKRRGRPPKFAPCEVDDQGKTWYACTVCGQKYDDRSELMYHMRQHNAVRNNWLHTMLYYVL